jgi:decaprenyl-phosphate phosphoribosyltransferase
VRLQPYLHIARIDHWFKNIFVLPGAALAIMFVRPEATSALTSTLIAVFCSCLLASANYTINEWLDSDFDRYHPIKKDRPGARGELNGGLVLFQYFLFAGAGLWLAATQSPYFQLTALAFLGMGLIYNVAPLRAKDKPYLDVLSEAINNPLRLLLGWLVIIPDALPPSSAILAYWMGGAFLMTVKRYSEYRFIDDPQRAANYRASFAYYNEERLLLSAFFYALCAAFFLGVFLIKYRIEFLLSLPLFAILFTWYLALGMRQASPTQTPEKLFREKPFVLYTIFLCIVIALLFTFDIPALDVLEEISNY